MIQWCKKICYHTKQLAKAAINKINKAGNIMAHDKHGKTKQQGLHTKIK